MCENAGVDGNGGGHGVSTKRAQLRTHKDNSSHAPLSHPTNHPTNNHPPFHQSTAGTIHKASLHLQFHHKSFSITATTPTTVSSQLLRRTPSFQLQRACQQQWSLSTSAWACISGPASKSTATSRVLSTSRTA